MSDPLAESFTNAFQPSKAPKVEEVEATTSKNIEHSNQFEHLNDEQATQSQPSQQSVEEANELENRKQETFDRIEQTRQLDMKHHKERHQITEERIKKEELPDMLKSSVEETLAYHENYANERISNREKDHENIRELSKKEIETEKKRKHEQPIFSTIDVETKRFKVGENNGGHEEVENSTILIDNEKSNSNSDSYEMVQFEDEDEGVKKSPSLKKYEDNAAQSPTLALFRRPTFKGLVAALAVNLLIPFVNGIALGFGEIFGREVLVGYFGFGRRWWIKTDNRAGLSTAGAGLR